MCSYVCVCVCVHSLIEVGFGYREEAAVAVRPDGEDEGLPCEHGELPHQFARVGDEQARVLLAVNHALVHVQHPRDDKLHTYILKDYTQTNKDISHKKIR